MRLVLIRHGEAQTALDGIVGCHEGCTGLSPHGRQQAERLRDRLARTAELADATVLYASILPRAVQTAEIIAPSLGSLPVQTSCDLCEQHAGEADGLSWEEADERYLTAGMWDDNPFRTFAPGGESVAQFVSRAGTALHDLAERHPDETVVVACHGGVIRAAYVAFGAVALPFLSAMHHDNTGITEWVRNGARPGWTLVRHNDAAHLLTSE